MARMTLPRLCAFDLDGTLLRDDKSLSSANRAALADMHGCGVKIALASGRSGSSMMRYADEIGVDVAMLTLNGAEVYKGKARVDAPIYHAPVAARYAEYLVRYADERKLALNYYLDGSLFAVRNRYTTIWQGIYHNQTQSEYSFVDSLDQFAGQSPSKLLIVGDADVLDKEEIRFRALWGNEVYIVRTWDYYLEFLDPRANKGDGLAALASYWGIAMADVAAFGDANNDIPMLAAAGMGIAMKNAGEEAKAAAPHVSPWTNQEDGVAREWEVMKRNCQ